VSRRLEALRASVAVAILVLAPKASLACAVCFQAKSDATRIAFIASTAAMTFLPLAVVGGVAWWVRRKFVQAEAPPTR
jgi:hypothetical protein